MNRSIGDFLMKLGFDKAKKILSQASFLCSIRHPMGHLEMDFESISNVTFL
jgi:hypothetical protein